MAKIKTAQKQEKVFVGLSGGVDSSVSAHFLKEKGYDVTGVFIKVWHPEFLECDWKIERHDAMRVCAHLGIPFKELDLSKEYKKDVADYMIEEYKKGRTPNPDVMCNKYVKFGGFLDWALKEGADYVATGHYARIKEDDGYKLQVGKDKNKDQSYFLWTLTQSQLSKIIFPVGDLEKSEVRKIAEKAGLFTADKKDSQGICFLGEISIKEFLTRLAGPEEGKVLNENGEVIGKHDGSILYTIGERRGFIITKKTPEDKPYFVVSKDIKENTITVNDKEGRNSSIFNAKEIKLTNTNWIPHVPKSGKYKARIRYRQDLQDCELNGDTVIFDKPQKAIAIGQSLVVYNGEVCLGGGIIDKVGVI